MRLIFINLSISRNKLIFIYRTKFRSTFQVHDKYNKRFHLNTHCKIVINDITTYAHVCKCYQCVIILQFSSTSYLLSCLVRKLPKYLLHLILYKIALECICCRWQYDKYVNFSSSISIYVGIFGLCNISETFNFKQSNSRVYSILWQVQNF